MITDIEGILKNIIERIQKFTEVAVIGLSGGADSTLVATLCAQALGKNNVYGIHMPATETDSKTFNLLSKKFATHLGINDAVIPICEPTHLIQKSVTSNIFKDTQNHEMGDLTKGNIKARLRMTILYAVAEEIHTTTGKTVRVIGTDNFSENSLGYFTKYGDGGVDINPIGELFKSEVYQLLDYLIRCGIIKEEHVNRIPSAGLWEGQTDEGELGFSYKEIEECIKNYHDVRMLMSNIKELNTPCYVFVLNKIKTNRHKNSVPPNISLRRHLYCDWEVFK
jgi:NAD+ synthase